MTQEQIQQLKLKIVYIVASVSTIANLALFNTLGKTVAENKLLKDTVLVQADTGIAMLKELIETKQELSDYQYLSRLKNDLGKYNDIYNSKY